LKRWLKFSAVGLIGIGVQMTAAFFFGEVLGWNYLTATAVAVEIAILHNFAWHERWTWSDRSGDGRWVRLLKFNGATGAASIIANVFWIRLLTQTYQIAYMPSSAMAIVLSSAVNFSVSELLVFRRKTTQDQCRLFSALPHSSGAATKSTLPCPR
jgi:putative flippase GtrA